MVYRFDQFEVDDREFRLSEGGVPVPVEPKVLRLLVYLIENRNRLVRKQELLDKIWPDAMVTENALTRAIVLLRKALNEDPRNPALPRNHTHCGLPLHRQRHHGEWGIDRRSDTTRGSGLSLSPRETGSGITVSEQVGSCFRRSGAPRRRRGYIPILPSQQEGLDRQRHGGARRLRQLHRRSSL